MPYTTDAAIIMQIAVMYNFEIGLLMAMKKAMQFIEAMRKDMKYDPVMDATWMKTRKLCWEWARKLHGKPVSNIPLRYSIITHIIGAER